MRHRPKYWSAAGLALALLGACGSARPHAWWGPFRARIVDAETKQPIAGAVVLALWWEEVGLFHSQTRVYETREALSGPDGVVELRRIPGSFFRWGVQRPDFRTFAPGYRLGDWVVTPPTGEPFIDPTVVEMRRVKTREERLAALPSRPSIPPEKMCLLTRAINQERRNLGINDPFTECTP